MDNAEGPMELGLEEQLENPDSIGYRIERSTCALEDAIRKNFALPNGIKVLKPLMGKHSMVIRSVLDEIFQNNDDYSNHENAGYAATILIEDDERRTNFLKEIVGEESAYLFLPNYPRHKMKLAEIEENLDDNDEDEDLEIQDYVDELMAEHNHYIEDSIGRFFNSDFVQEKLNDNLPIQPPPELQEIKMHLSFSNRDVVKLASFGALALTASSIISKAVWQSFKRR
ncbi:MAG: hypothetical protein ACXWLH_01090 [Candidatus Saccharimonadales bacterium]